MVAKKDPPRYKGRVSLLLSIHNIFSKPGAMQCVGQKKK